MKRVKILLFILLQSIALISLATPTQTIQVLRASDSAKHIVRVIPPQSIQVVLPKQERDYAPIYIACATATLTICLTLFSVVFWPNYKAKQRVKMVRNYMFYQIKNWQKGLYKQVSVLREVYANIDWELEQEYPQFASFDYEICLDMSPVKLKEISLEDNIAIIARNRLHLRFRRKRDKTEGKFLLPQYVNFMEWAMVLTAQIKTYEEGLRVTLRERNVEFESTFSQLQSLIVEFKSQNSEGDLRDFSNQLMEVLVEAKKLKIGNLEGYIEQVIKPVIVVLETKHTLPISKELFKLCKQLNALYTKTKLDKMNDLVVIGGWLDYLNRMKVLVGDILRLEFQKDEKFYEKYYPEQVEYLKIHE